MMPSGLRARVTLSSNSLGEMPVKEDAGALPVTCGTAGTREGRQKLMSRLDTEVGHAGVSPQRLWEPV